MKIEFIKATVENVDDLIDIQNQCFYSDYLKYGECPGYNHSVESMTSIVVNRITYLILCDKRIIGDIIVKNNNDNTYHLCGICVIPDYQNKGIGQMAIEYIENQFPCAVAWTLETPKDKESTRHFYKKMGYAKIKEYMDGTVKIVLLEKRLNKVLWPVVK